MEGQMVEGGGMMVCRPATEGSRGRNRKTDREKVERGGGETERNREARDGWEQRGRDREM